MFLYVWTLDFNDVVKSQIPVVRDQAPKVKNAISGWGGGEELGGCDE